MSKLKKVLVLLVIVFIVMQFIQPKRNTASATDPNDISKVYDIPEPVYATLKTKCYDCHSNNTNYPWYFHVQPIGWWLAAHVHEGKEHLDFSSFKTYSQKKATHKLEEVVESVEDGWMPLQAYTILHPHAKVTEEEEKAIKDWISNIGK